ncbi:MAG: hypoxanthine phosphoribosyltransferase [Bacteroidales bacterium]|nr:hypoxanthine phosphoribosyltransferase [Bacteroidales bacterium]
MESEIKIKDKTFKKYIRQNEISGIIDSLAQRINSDYTDMQSVVFIVMLNGAFMFAADLLKRIKGLPTISFVKFSSYNSTDQSGKIKQLIGLNEDLTDKHVIIVEDIVDTGLTMKHFLQQMEGFKYKTLDICTLMFKPGKFQEHFPIKYIGKEISDEFIIGYGFDLDGTGRNFADIYQLKEN